MQLSTRREGPKRSSLAQERSRETRRKLVKAALDLWNERGFETGIDSTTAEEIAARAGVAKGTFYFHFARKEQVLLEMGWLTARALYEDALRALANGRSLDAVLDQLMTKLARRIEKAPRAAVGRMIQEFHRAAESELLQDREHFGFQRAFSVVFTHAQDSGEVPSDVSPRDLAAMLTALVMDGIKEWTEDERVDLAAVLRQRTALLLAGARNLVVAPPRRHRASGAARRA
ncbi:MAG: TetR family transcriptional regulator [Acidimicrobiales bacterium]